MVAGLGALYALILAAAPVRSFFDLELLSAGQWFLCLLYVAAGLVLAALAWRLPYIQVLEAPDAAEPRARAGAHEPAPPEIGSRCRARTRGRRTKIVATIGPATRSVEIMAELIRAGADVLRLNFSHGTRDEHAENIAMAREASEVAGREVGLLGDLPGPKLRIDEVEGGVVELQTGSEVTLDDRRGGRRRRPPARVVGGASIGGSRGRGDLSRRRPDPAPRRADTTSDEIALRGRGRRPGRLTPGAERAGHRRAAAGGEPNGPRLGRLRRQAAARPARGLVRASGRGPAAGRAARPSRRRRHPADREDREAAGGRERRGDHPRRVRRDHGRARRPRHRAPDRAGADGPEAAARARRHATRARRSPPRRCSPRWSPRRDPPAPRSPTSPPPSTREPMR